MATHLLSVRKGIFIAKGRYDFGFCPGRIRPHPAFLRKSTESLLRALFHFLTVVNFSYRG